MTNTVENGAPEAAAVPPPRVRMDRSRAYATVHGERGPNDRHARVSFIQDGIPADAGGFFIFDHPDMLEPGPDGDKRRKAAERKIARALKQQAKVPEAKAEAASTDEDEDDEDDEAAGDDEELEPINLEAWLRGEQEVEWQEITQEIARRFKRRITKIEDAVEFLVAEGIVPKGQLRKKFLKHVS